MAENGTLSTNQRKALKALLSEPTVRDAAQAAGLGERTVHRYLADATFKAELRRRQDQVIAATTAALVGLSGEAVKTLRDILESRRASNAVKARVALGWLKHTREAVELDDLAQRVAVLEGKLEEW